MTLRVAAIRERLRKLDEVLSHLQTLQALPRGEFLGSVQHYWVAERGLQLAAEAVFDIGNHILAGRFNVHPSDYEDVVKRLAEQGVISAQLRERLRGLGGLRNILVHGYLDIDRDLVWNVIQDELGKFTAFAKAVEDFLKNLDDTAR